MNPLQLRLASLRHRMILVNFWRGSCTLFAVIAGILLFEGLSDYKVHLPAPLRGLFLVGTLFAFGTVFVRYLYLPMTRRLDDLSLALRIEEIYPELNDNLATAVQFLDEPDENLSGSKIMRKHTIEDALKRADHCDFANIIDRRGVLVRPIAALLIGLAAAHFVYHHWAFTAKAMVRLVDPFGGHSWTQVDVDEPPARIAQGQSYTLRGQLAGIIPDKARLEIEGTLTQTEKVIHVKRESEPFAGSFQTPLDMGNRPGKFRFRILANDGTYPAHGGFTSWIQIQAPPRLAPLDGQPSPQVELEYRGYTDLRSPERLSPGPDPQVSAVAGTKVRWRAAVDRPVVAAWLEHPGGKIDCQIDPSGTVLSVAFVPAVTASATAKVHFKDALGLGNVEKIELNIYEDTVPMLQLKKPQWSVEKMLPGAQVTLHTAIKDLLGNSGPPGAIRSVFIEYRRKTSNGVDWADDKWRKLPIFESDLISVLAALGQNYQGFALPVRIRPADLDVTYAWQLRGQFKEGDIVSLRVCADDYCDLDPKSDRAGRTKDIDIVIVSKREFQQEIDTEFEKAQRQIDNLLRDQEAALELVKEVEAKKDGDQQARHDKLIAAKQKQATIKNIIGAHADDGLRKSLADLKDKMKENKLPPSSMQDSVNTLTRELDRLARVDLPQIEDNLAKAIRDLAKPEGKPEQKPLAPAKPDPGKKDAKDPLEQARTSQEKAAKTLAELARFLDPWANQQQIKDRIIKLQAEQKNLKKDTEALVKKDSKAVTKTDLDPRAERQDNLANQASELLKSIKEVIAQQKGSETAEKLADVAKIAEKSELTAKMRDISGQLRDTRQPKLNDSVRMQGEVLKSLDKMLAALDEKDRGEQLDKLSKKQKKAQSDLDQLQKKMVNLDKKIDEARKIADPMARAQKMKDLAPEQKALEEEAQKLSRDLARLQAEKAARDLDQAAQDMAAAGAKMQNGEDPGEAQPQIGDDLKQAKADLEQAQQELAREKNALIADKLKGIKEREDSLLAESERIHKTMMEKKKWSGPLLQSLKDSGETQSKLATIEAEVIRKQLESSPIFEYRLKKAQGSMEKAAAAIEARTQERPKDQLLENEQIEDEKKDQDRIVKLQKNASDQLQRLIDALKQDPPEKKPAPKPKEAAKPDKEDPDKKPKEPQPAGARPGDGIPPSAEIKELIKIQEEVRQQRKEFDERFPDRAKLNDEQRTELSAIVTEQTAIEDLFRRTMQRNKKEGDQP